MSRMIFNSKSCLVCELLERMIKTYLSAVKSLRNISTSKEKIPKLRIFMRKNQKTLRESNLYPRTVNYRLQFDSNLAQPFCLISFFGLLWASHCTLFYGDFGKIIVFFTLSKNFVVKKQ